jgi:hypothetical protein
MRTLQVLGALALVSCSVGDPFVPTVDNMAGQYTASQIVFANPSGVVNWIDSGGTLTMTLSPNATTSGRLFLPGGAEGGGDLDADMAGTWLLIGNTIQFGQAAQTFVRAMDFSAGQNRIAGDHYFADSLRVIIVLFK